MLPLPSQPSRNPTRTPPQPGRSNARLPVANATSVALSGALPAKIAGFAPRSTCGFMGSPSSLPSPPASCTPHTQASSAASRRNGNTYAASCPTSDPSLLPSSMHSVPSSSRPSLAQTSRSMMTYGISSPSASNQEDSPSATPSPRLNHCIAPLVKRHHT
ncbi:hypothetical protein ACHAW6_003944 [Cyclotella cf. meneghiniana]